MLFLCCTVLAHDLDTVTFYDSKGEFVGVRRAGSGKPIKVGCMDVYALFRGCAMFYDSKGAGVRGRAARGVRQTPSKWLSSQMGRLWQAAAGARGAGGRERRVWCGAGKSEEWAVGDCWQCLFLLVVPTHTCACCLPVPLWSVSPSCCCRWRGLTLSWRALSVAQAWSSSQTLVCRLCMPALGRS